MKNNCPMKKANFCMFWVSLCVNNALTSIGFCYLEKKVLKAIILNLIKTLRTV